MNEWMNIPSLLASCIHFFFIKNNFSIFILFSGRILTWCSTSNRYLDSLIIYGKWFDIWLVRMEKHQVWEINPLNKSRYFDVLVSTDAWIYLSKNIQWLNKKNENKPGLHTMLTFLIWIFVVTWLVKEFSLIKKSEH